MIGVIIGTSLGVIGVIMGIWAAIKFSFGTAFKCKAKEGVKPVTKKSLISKLEKLNKKNPFKFSKSKDGFDLQVEWDVVDSKWIEMLGKGWLSIKYTGVIVLDQKTKTLRYNEKIVEKSRTMGPMGAYGNTSFQQGMIISRRIKSYRFGIKEDGSIGEVYNFDFKPLDLKGLIRQVANDNGWNFIIHFSRSRMKKV